MEDLYERIETGHYVAYSVVFKNPYGVMYNTTTSALFGTEEDAEMYADSVHWWWNSMFPSCCVPGCISADVFRELVTFDGKIIHGMSGRTWSFVRVKESSEKFATWKSGLSDRKPTLSDCEVLVRDMKIPFSDEKRIRCLPWLRDRFCLLECFMMTLMPKSVPKPLR